ncbi:kunitz-type protease inhibitor 1a isoform 1-T1 [Pholidichthys leucotaenia]
MDPLIKLGALLLLLVLTRSVRGQAFGMRCLDNFKKGQEDFVLETDESVKNGATFLASPPLTGWRDCVVSCCKRPRCNVAFMERGDEGLIKSCFLFDCLYNNKYVCRFVRKGGYDGYILESLYERYLEVYRPPDTKDNPPIANGGPNQVVQPRQDVILKGLLSKDDKKIMTYSWKMLTEYQNAVIQDSSYTDQMIVSNLTSGTYMFQLTVTDEIGQSDTATVIVLVLTPEQSKDYCMAPKKIGPCRGSFPRWYYNATLKKCEEFRFGGCRNNLNNYLTEDECENACQSFGGTVGSGRGLPLDPAEKCSTLKNNCTEEQFTCANGCCLDPGLECDSIKQCSDGSDEQNCQDLKDKFRSLLSIPLNEKKVRCTAPPSPGTCRNGVTKWYYSPHSKQCSRFNYGGCEGNENRFEDKDSCERICEGITEKDIFIIGPKARVADSQTGILAIAVILGLAILILLGIVLYCFFKGRKKSQQYRTPVGAVPISTFEDRDHLVYNSTTKPI